LRGLEIRDQDRKTGNLMLEGGELAIGGVPLATGEGDGLISGRRGGKGLRSGARLGVGLEKFPE
jgi:hypothetical protein